MFPNLGAYQPQPRDLIRDEVAQHRAPNLRMGKTPGQPLALSERAAMLRGCHYCVEWMKVNTHRKYRAKTGCENFRGPVGLKLPGEVPRGSPQRIPPVEVEIRGQKEVDGTAEAEQPVGSVGRSSHERESQLRWRSDLAENRSQALQTATASAADNAASALVRSS
jgi:hypothetical protein